MRTGTDRPWLPHPSSLIPHPSPRVTPNTSSATGASTDERCPRGDPSLRRSGTEPPPFEPPTVPPPRGHGFYHIHSSDAPSACHSPGVIRPKSWLLLRRL